MLKQNKWTLVLTSLLILLPAGLGVCFWDKLPLYMPIHWNVNGEVDGYASRAVAVFAMPLISLALHWLCVFVTLLDPKNRGQNRTVKGLVLWLLPVVCWFVSVLVYTMALGHPVPVTQVTLGWMGVLFIVLGNYLPKCKQNHTIGIKIAWTLNNEENWNATHRFSGRVWMIGGVLMLLGAFLPLAAYLWLVLATALLLVLAPVVYSYVYYRRHE